MAHLDHKERAVSRHHEWDVSKGPFSPPGIIELGLKAPKKEPAQPRVPPSLIVSKLWTYSFGIPLWGATKVCHFHRGVGRNLRHELRT